MQSNSNDLPGNIGPNPRLFMVLLGASIAERNTEQHDVFFGIGETIESLFEPMKKFWPAAGTKLHIDAWREITAVDDFTIRVVRRSEPARKGDNRLFFINLGGYRRNEFEEFHYKLLTVASNKMDAIAASKQTAFFRHAGFKGATSHIDDKFGVDVDDIFQVPDILSPEEKSNYSLRVDRGQNLQPDELHLGYIKLKSV